MSEERVPLAQPTRRMSPLASLSRKRPKHFSSLDRLRLQRWHELRETGMGAIQAYTEVVTDPELGTRDWRGKTAMPAGVAASGLARFLERAAPEMVAEARATARVEAAGLTSRMVHVIRDVALGDFGEGRVRTVNGVETVSIDAAAARVRMEAAAKILTIGGAMPRAQDTATGPQGGVGTAVQVNVGPTAHEVAQALARDPAAHAAAMDAARRVSAPPPPPPADDWQPVYTDPDQANRDIPEILRP
jgi:hypothetical protein